MELVPPANGRLFVVSPLGRITGMFRTTRWSGLLDFRQKARPRTALHCAIAFSAIGLLWAGSASAITSSESFGSSPNGRLANSSFASVGAIRFDDGATCTGTLD